MKLSQSVLISRKAFSRSMLSMRRERPVLAVSCGDVRSYRSSRNCRRVLSPWKLAPLRIPDPAIFRSGRDLSAWIGLVPKQHSTGGKERLGSISKAGNRYLRTLLVVGALSVIRRAKQLGYTRHPWLVRLLERRSIKVAAIALANKIARIAWAMMSRNETYQPSLLTPK